MINKRQMFGFEESEEKGEIYINPNIMATVEGYASMYNDQFLITLIDGRRIYAKGSINEVIQLLRRRYG